jgi:hypothetical protein
MGPLICCSDDSPDSIRASGAYPAGPLVLPEEEGALHLCPPLGYVDHGWPAMYRAHRMVELLCAPADSVGPWSDEFVRLAHRPLAIAHALSQLM